jgi:transposase
MRQELPMARRKLRSFTPEYKAGAARLVQVGDRSIRGAAKALDLTETALREWTKDAAVDADKGPPGALTTAPRGELTWLRRDVKRLEMEREKLKKNGGIFREGEQVRFELIAAKKARYPVDVSCAALEVSRSG